MDKRTDIHFPANEFEKIFIKSIWRLSEFDVNKKVETILPKGTVELIFNFSDQIDYVNPALQISRKLPTVFINGLNFNPFKLLKTGCQDFLGVQLNAPGLKLLFNISANEFNDRVYEGSIFCPCLDSLSNELFGKQTFNEQVEAILKWVRKKVSFVNYGYSIDRVQRLMCLNFFRELTVKKISDEICLSERQLRRFSTEWLGMSTEEFILYNKYLISLQLLHDSKWTLTEIGLKAGYYDQSHFIREFKSYTELTPKEYRKIFTDFPGHIFV
ncbi:MAG: helix-turn-helix transcriptional regulator [Saprospiraceae bacterium]|nr:helix-turn-helix transcriptional regulator [Candidatus Vicinibacter affinis]MBP6173979.1 helix-turn-helix transcriptional regulator [Saprospiraceae bacterium]MBK6574317.1 helix-turn-helix transcriptional regulator [Candidatus Vicinibacter affinis]MBK7305491.1 helix-turn-helix transcriptional regulator [Candidatus Vicinibacter affinis]MBK7800873.1 helix-turn-helix transcriptional regulator [Candidatus Vicinibacter affinis]